MSSEVPIQVAVRVRPLLGEEIHRNLDPCLHCVPNKPQLLIGKDRHFTFNYVFPPATSQGDVYNDCVESLIPSFFEGYNVTVFAYGQTGSGKTYTMGTGNCVYLDEEERGIVPRAVTDIFDQISALSGHMLCKVRVSFIEVYREETTDLLENSTKNLQIREDESGNIVVVGVREEAAESMEEVLHLLDAGTAIRHVGSTNMNDVSSRSHCIFSIILDQHSIDTQNAKGSVLTSRFHFVDLAGSERAHRTGNQGERFKESVSINSGLLALGNVISALSDPKRKGQHIPYRESKLTRLLKDSLGGNSRTLMITCLSSALADLDENINSLKYATRASTIRNKPIVNWDMEASTVSRMENEIHVLRNQLKKRISNQSEMHEDRWRQKICDLEIENEKHEEEQHHYLQSLHEVNVLLQAVESSVPLSSQLVHEIMKWRHNWERSHIERPVTAPSIRSATVRRPQNNIIENLRNEVTQLKDKLRRTEAFCQDIDELKQEVIAFGQENAQLRLELDIAINKEGELKEKLFEQQLMIQHVRRGSVLTRGHHTEERAAENNKLSMTPQDRILQNFRVRNEMLMSQLEDLDVVETDENISSDEEDRVLKQQSEPTLSRGKRFASQIPRPFGSAKVRSKNTLENGRQEKPNIPPLDLSSNRSHTLAKLHTSRDTVKHEMKTAGISVREVTSRLKELELNIQQKEGLIDELLRSEQEAKATSGAYKEKLSKLEKDFEKSKRELEEAQQKINLYEPSNNKDNTQRNKLENDYKKKLKVMQKKFDDFKQKENISNRISSYQIANEKKVKDLEAWISRMKNQQSELDRKLKSENEKKVKFEQDLIKNERRIKELEQKTDQQQKLLKRKNEEVVAAQRKLRTSLGNEAAKQTSDKLEKRKQWLDDEIEKIMKRQRDVEILEQELYERDESLRKKESLMLEKERLEVKKTKSNQSLSKSIMQLSVQMGTVDERIQELQKQDQFGKDLQQLEDVKQELTVQKQQLDQTVLAGGLESQDQRRLIELAEAIDAVDEAITFRNDLISQKRSFLNEEDLDNYRNIEHLLTDMGELSAEEYKHLLGRMFLKVIELRKLNEDADDTRFHFEMKVSDQEKTIVDLNHTLQVIESRFEKELIEQNSKYEKEIQFLMEQLRLMENEATSRENHTNSALENKIVSLERDLHRYRLKSRSYKDHLKDFTNNVSLDTTAPEELAPREGPERKSSAGHKQKVAGNARVLENGNEFHLPPVRQRGGSIDRREKWVHLDQNALDEHKRLQDIFESKGPSSPSTLRAARRTSIHRKKASEENFTDSIEIGKQHWNQL